MWRRFLIVTMLLFGLAAALASFVKSQRVRLFIRNELHALALKHLQLDVQVARVTVQLLPPALLLEQVQVANMGATEPLVKMRACHIQPRPWPSPSGALVLHRLAIDGLEVATYFDLSGLWVPESGPQSPITLGLPIDVHTLELTDSSILVQQANRWVKATGINLSSRPAAVGGRQISFSLAQGSAFLPGWVGHNAAFTFSAQAEAQLIGTFDRPQTLALTAAHITLPGLDFTASGDVGLQGALDLNLATTLRAKLADLSAFIPELPSLDGDAIIDVSLRGSAHAPSTGVVVTAHDLQVDHEVLGEMQMEAALKADSVVVESFRLAHPEGGTLTGSGRVELGDKQHLIEMSARLHDISLPHVLQLSGIPDAWVRMRLSGDVQATGDLTPLRVELDADLTTQNFDVLDRSYRKTNPAYLLSIPLGSVRGSATLQKHNVVLHHVQVGAGESQVAVDGTLSYDVREGVALAVSSDNVHFADLGPVASVPFAGMGQVNATVEGPYENLTISSTLQAVGMRIWTYALGTTTATLIYHDGLLEIDRLNINHNGGVVTGAGRLNFVPARVQLEGIFEVESLDVGDLLTTLGVSKSISQHFVAPLAGRVLLSGPLQEPTGVLHVKADKLRVDGVALGPLTYEGSFGDAGALFSGTLYLRPQTGALKLFTQVDPRGDLVIQGDVRDVPLSLVAPFIGNLPLLGHLDGHVDLHGLATTLSGDINLRIADLEVFSVHFEDTVAEAVAQNGVLALRGTVLSGDVPLTGELILGRTLPFHATATLKDVALARLIPYNGEVGLHLTGAVHAQGDLTAPDNIVADSDLSRITLTWRDVSLDSRTPTHAHYASELLQVAPTTFVGPSLQGTAAGSLSLDSAVHLTLAASGDLAVLADAIPAIHAAQGAYTLQLLVGGTLSAPTLTGEADLPHGRFHVGDAEQVVDKLQSHVVFNGRSIAIQNSSASVGTGTVRFAGEAALFSEEGAEFNIRAGLQAVPVHPLTDLDATLTGDAQLVGPLNNLLLKGKLHIDALRYTARLELDKLVGKRTAPPLRAPTSEPGRAVRLALKLNGANNIIISSNVLEAELQADLTLTGTSDRPGLLGNVTPLWARARYRDNIFKIVRASIDFTDEYRLFTEFQVQARTEACKMTADVSIQGNSDSYIVTPYGQDERGVVDPQDVLTCLQFGLRLHDFDGNQRAPAGLSDALRGSVDALWTVSGLDEKVKKLLPIEVDELRLTSGWSSLSQRTTARVLVGKELGNHLALKYSRSLDEFNDQSFSLEYRLAERTSMLGTWLSVRDVPVGDFGVDVRLHWELQ